MSAGQGSVCRRTASITVRSLAGSFTVITLCAVAISGPALRPPVARAQAGAPPIAQPIAQPVAHKDEPDLTPWEQSAEVRELVSKGTFAPDPGEPAGAIKIYLDTADEVRTAMRRINVGKLPGEPDVDPDKLLDNALAARRQSTSLYPNSRHAWEGVGDVLWLKYNRRHRAADLREAVDAYEHAADLLMRQGSTGGSSGRDFVNIVSNISRGLAALSDHAGFEAFFQQVKGTEFWRLAEGAYAAGLGALDDPRADQVFRELLASTPPGSTLGAYVDYLMDHGRYQEALAVFDRRDQATLGPMGHAMRGAMLERLGRVGEARAEYQHYLDAVASSPLGQGSGLPDRYRIPGSSLQRGMKFHPSDHVLPKPRSGLLQPLVPRSSAADGEHRCGPSRAASGTELDGRPRICPL